MNTMELQNKTMHGIIEGVVEERKTSPGFWGKDDVWVPPRFEVRIRLRGGSQIAVNLRDEGQFQKFQLGQTVKVGFMLIM